MIKELKIKNFLSFKDEVVFSFEATSDRTLGNYYVSEQQDGTRLLKLAMVYGANASGKSNLIAAFQFLKEFTSSIREDKGMSTRFIPFMFDNTIEEPGELELVFYPNGKKHKYELSLTGSEIIEEKLFYYPGTQPALIFERKFNKKNKTSEIEFGSKINISDQAIEAIQLKTLKNTSVLAAYNQVNISISEMDTTKEWFDDQFLNSINPYMDLTNYSDEEIQKSNDVKMHVLEFLKEADFNITDVKFEDSIKKLPDFLLKNIDTAPISEEQKELIRKEKAIHVEETVFTHKIVRDGKEMYFHLPENRQSQGTLRYYGLSAPFYNTIKRNAFLAIDEIDSALHPLLVIHFISEFLKRSKNAQLLFTTHNMSLLNEKDILRKDAIWFTEKKEDGSSDLFSMSDFNFRKELSFFNAYKIGKFGAIPELK